MLCSLKQGPSIIVKALRLVLPVIPKRIRNLARRQYPTHHIKPSGGLLSDSLLGLSRTATQVPAVALDIDLFTLAPWVVFSHYGWKTYFCAVGFVSGGPPVSVLRRSLALPRRWLSTEYCFSWCKRSLGCRKFRGLSAFCGPSFFLCARVQGAGWFGSGFGGAHCLVVR